MKIRNFFYILLFVSFLGKIKSSEEREKMLEIIAPSSATINHTAQNVNSKYFNKTQNLAENDRISFLICPKGTYGERQQLNSQNSLEDGTQKRVVNEELCEKSMLIGGKDSISLIYETAECIKLKDHELIDIFEGLNFKLKKISKFYYYHDVLSLIDKLIATIYEFLDVPNRNISRNFMNLRRINKKISPDLKKLQKRLTEIEKIIDEKKDQNSLNFTCVENEIDILKKQAECFRHRYDFRRNKEIQNEYYLDNTNKHKKLQNLQEFLKNIKEKILTMEETNIEKYAKFFKDKYLKILLEVHEGIINCLNEENTSLDWLFEICDAIMNEVGVCIEKLNLHDKIFKHKEH